MQCLVDVWMSDQVLAFYFSSFFCFASPVANIVLEK